MLNAEGSGAVSHFKEAKHDTSVLNQTKLLSFQTYEQMQIISQWHENYFELKPFEKSNGPGPVATLAGASSPHAKAVASIPGKGIFRNQPIKHR